MNLRRVLEKFKERISYKNFQNYVEGPIMSSVLDGINNALDNRWQLAIYYLGDEGKTKPGWRYIEPYVLGLNLYTGNTILRAYSLSGLSTGWVTFRLDRIRNIAVLSSKPFDKPMFGYTGPTDELMRSIIKAVQFPNHK